jgi:hypothetical protein
MSRVLTAVSLWIFLAFLSPSTVSAVADENYSGRGWSSHWTPQEWTGTSDYADIRNYADRPDEKTLSGLSIEWQKPSLDALGNICTIRGQVTMPDKRQKRGKPINWFQGVMVYLGKTPAARPDWSKGMNEADTLSNTAITTPAGRFEVHFDMRDSKHSRDRIQSFQFGVALAKHTITGKASQRVIWNSRTSAIPSAIQMLAVPAAPPLSRELQLINRASRWPFTKPNGVELIRAVNSLHPLGKERALATLEKYVALTPDSGYGSDQEIVFWIIRMLFEPVRLGDRIPYPGIAVFLDDRAVPDAVKWPLNPMAVYGDVPFMVGHRINGSGVPEHPGSHIHWARLHGAIRDEPLVPTGNPLGAAEAILRSPRFKVLDKFSRDHATQAIRSQALAMVKGLVQPVGKDHSIADDQWRSRLKTATETGIHWDTKRQVFVRGKNIKLSAVFWEDLGAGDAKIAEAAVWHGAAAGDAAVARLELKLTPAAAVDAEKVADLVRRLDAKEFSERAKANAALARLGPDAEAALRDALPKAATLEARRRIDGILKQQEATHRHRGRAVEVLEMIGTPAARRLLANLAKGASTSRLTRAAKVALDRLETTP